MRKKGKEMRKGMAKDVRTETRKGMGTSGPEHKHMSGRESEKKTRQAFGLRHGRFHEGQTNARGSQRET
jgi:hypothetical protein